MITVAKIATAARARAADLPTKLPADEAFWALVRDAFEGVRSSNFLGTVARGCSPCVVTDAVTDCYLLMNQTRRGGNNYPERKEEVQRRVALHVGCSPEEIALTRNTTDGITTVISAGGLSALCR